jgi:hypothetical protein
MKRSESDTPLRVLATIPLFLLLGCGGSGTPVAVPCVAPTVACGGDPTGTWQLKSECATTLSTASQGSSSVCAGFSLTNSFGSGSTYTFSAGGKLQMSISGTYTEAVTIPVSCLNSDAGASAACAASSTALKDEAQTPGYAAAGSSTVSSGSCALDSEGRCACTITATIATLTGSGTYVTNGGQMTTTMISPGPDPDAGAYASSTITSSYCVSGNTLTLFPQAGAGATTNSVSVFMR